MVKMILRIQNGIDPSPTLLENLKAALGDFEIQYFEPLGPDAPVDFSVHYQKRIDCILNAFDFLVDNSSDSNKDKLRVLSQWLREKYTLPEKLDQDACEYQRGECLGVVIDALMQEFGFSKEKAKEYLNLADQYDLLRRGRPNQATLTDISKIVGDSGGNPRWALQVDKQVDPLHPDTKKEFYNIKTHDHPDTIPDEFLKLSATSQLYLLNMSPANLMESCPESLAGNIQVELGRIMEKCEELSKLYESSEHPLPDDLNLKANDPNWFSDKESACFKRLFRELYIHCNKNFKTILKEIKNTEKEVETFVLSEKYNKSLLELPFWYYQQSPWERRFLWSVLQELDSEHFNLVPSRLRSILTLANAKKRSLYTVEENDTLRLLSGDRLYSAHLASRKTIKLSPTIQFLHCQRNLEQIVKLSGKPEKTPLFEGTLITPIEALVKIPGLPPDTFLHKTLNWVVKSLVSQGFPKIYTHNHAVNYWRNFSYASNNDIKSNDFLAYLKSWLEENGETPAAVSVRIMVEQYESILVNKPDWDDIRALFVAALEYRLAQRTGLIAHDTCVSGKDREGLLQVILDAKDLFEFIYKKFPELHKEDEYLKLTVLFLILLSNEHQILEAEFGAPGAHGLKTLSRYLPSDIVDIINRWGLNAEAMDVMASSNDLDKIKLENFRLGYSGALMEALSIPPEAVETIYTQMRDHCPLSIIDKLPTAWNLPLNLQGALISPEWLADLLHNKDTAFYIRWLIRARNIQPFLIQDLVSLNHKIIHLPGWEGKSTTTGKVLNTLTWNLFGSSHESAIPQGIIALRNIMTDNRAVTDPLGICTEILFAIHAQLDRDSWFRWPETTEYYGYLDKILANENIADPQQWIELCRPLYAMLSRIDLSGHFYECNEPEVIKILFALIPAGQSTLNLSNNNLARFGEKLSELLSVIPDFVKTIDLRNNSLNELDSKTLKEVISKIPADVKIVFSATEFKKGSSQRSIVEELLKDSERCIFSDFPIEDKEKKAGCSYSHFFPKPLPVQFTDPEDKQKLQEQSLS